MGRFRPWPAGTKCRISTTRLRIPSVLGYHGRLLGPLSRFGPFCFGCPAALGECWMADGRSALSYYRRLGRAPAGAERIFAWALSCCTKALPLESSWSDLFAIHLWSAAR